MKYYDNAVILLESGKFTYEMGRELIADMQIIASKDDNCPPDELEKLDRLADNIDMYICAVEDIIGDAFPEAV